jgi:hypothetical protein
MLYYLRTFIIRIHFDMIYVEELQGSTKYMQ